MLLPEIEEEEEGITGQEEVVCLVVLVLLGAILKITFEGWRRDRENNRNEK